MASDWEGLSIGFADDMFTESPTWTRIDTQSGVRVARMSGKTGRQSEWEETDTGTLTIEFNDREGIVDPTNAADLDGKPIALALRNPVTDEWFPRFRGVIEDVDIQLDRSARVLRTTITAVDLFDYLANYEMTPGLDGSAVRYAGVDPPAGTEGSVVYEDTAGTVDDLIKAILADTGLPVSTGNKLTTTFSGNVKTQAFTLAPSETALDALRMAADAEFPTVANIYVDKKGRVSFHGRFARFDPATVAASATGWDFNTWKAGDGAAIAADSTRALVRAPFGVQRSRRMVRNVAICYPKGIVQADKETQSYEDATSRATYGTRTWTKGDLIIKEGSTTGNTAEAECLLYAQYIVENYKNPRNRVPQISIGPRHPSDRHAARNWALITGIDISDVVDLDIGFPGGGGVDEEYFVEGLSWTMAPGEKDLDTGWPDITMTADLSPKAYWGTNPFPT